MVSLTRAQALKYRAAMLKGAEALSDAEALAAPMLFERWAEGIKYPADKRLCHNGELYKTLQEHTSQADWTPDVAVSLYVRVDDPSIEWPDWKQPQGAHDAYTFGAKVSHNSKHWISNYDGANIWEPGIFGWDEAE